MTAGLTYRKGRFHDSTVHVLTVDLNLRRIAPVPVGPDYPCYRYYNETTRPPQLAEAAGALASVGSDYSASKYAGVPLTSQPIGAFALSGELWTTGQRGGAGKFVIAQGRAFITHEPVSLTVVTDAGGFEVQGMNTARAGAFTIRGGTNATPTRGHHAVLGESGPDGTREVLSLQRAAPIEGQIVLQSSQPSPLTVGQSVHWLRSIHGESFQHIISGAPVLVRNGVNVVSMLSIIARPPPGPDGWWVRKNPRTVLGLSDNGRTAYVVAVEGRIASSKGLRLKELGTLMLKVGATDALNLDGGGSTHLWLRDRGLVAPGCYNPSATLEGTRPQAYATCIF